MVLFSTLSLTLNTELSPWKLQLSITVFCILFHHLSLADIREVQGAPAPGRNSFNFMQSLGEFGKIVCWCPPWKVGAPTSSKAWIRLCFDIHRNWWQICLWRTVRCYCEVFSDGLPQGNYTTGCDTLGYFACTMESPNKTVVATGEISPLSARLPVPVMWLTQMGPHTIHVEPHAKVPCLLGKTKETS